MISLKRIIEQQGSEQYYDIGIDFVNFKRVIDGTDEQIKQRFEQLIGAKLTGKRVRARASRGYKQFVKDYEFDVAKITLDDYYDNYVIVATDQSKPKPKEYFLKPGYKVVILGSATGQPSPQKGGNPAQSNKPSNVPQEPNQPIGKTAETPQAPEATNNNSYSDSERPLQENDDESDNNESKYDGEGYSIDSIQDDIRLWLPSFLKNDYKHPLSKETPDKYDFRRYVSNVGLMKKFSSKTDAIFDLQIPTDNIIAKMDNNNRRIIALTKDALQAKLNNINKSGAAGISYTLISLEPTEEQDAIKIRMKKTMRDTTRI